MFSQLTSDESLEEDLEDGSCDERLDEGHSGSSEDVNALVSNLVEESKREEVRQLDKIAEPVQRKRRTNLEESDEDEGDQERQSSGEKDRDNFLPQRVGVLKERKGSEVRRDSSEQSQLEAPLPFST